LAHHQENATLAIPLRKFQNIQLSLIFPHFDLFHVRNKELVSSLPLPQKFVVRSDQTSNFVSDFCVPSSARF
jgi:hypothetical protein